MKRLASILPLVLAACVVWLPPRDWARGGAPVDVPEARWTFGERVTAIDRQGRVTINGEPQFSIDGAGRIADADANALALLEPDGRVVGPDESNLGFVGATSAARPGERRAWLELLPSGEVVRFDEEGERHPFGFWVGECARSPSSEQACMLVTHLLGMRLARRDFTPGGVSVGVGIGVGVVGR